MCDFTSSHSSLCSVLTYLNLTLLSPPSPPLPHLEEVGVAIGVLQGVVNVVGQAFPVGDGLGVAVLDGWPQGRIEAPVL